MKTRMHQHTYSPQEAISAFRCDVPDLFLKDFARCLKGVYRGCATLCREILEKPERRDVHSTMRRAITEGQFRSLAKRHNAHVKAHHTRRGTARFTTARFNRIVLTQAGVADIHEVVRPARYRNALAIGQLPLLEHPDSSDHDQSGEQLLYGILLHGPRMADVEQPSFYRVAFLSQDCTVYAAALPLTELLSDTSSDVATADEDPANFMRPRRAEDEQEEG